MELSFIVLALLSCISATIAFDGQFHDRFSHFETLHHTDIHHEVVKRSADSARNEMVFSVDTLGKHFRLHLHSARGLFSRDFQVYTVDKSKHREKVDFNTKDFYEGYIEGEPESSVNAFWEGHDLVATIDTKDDTYVIEPSWRHLPTDDAYSMISYRKSDMKQRTERDMGESYCGFVHPDRDDASTENFEPIRTDNKRPTGSHRRHKRQSSSQTNCQVALIADYHFYQDIGSSNEGTTVNYMATIMSFVNRIFRTTTFGSNAGYAMQIREVDVHKEPTSTSGVHYNMARSGSQWDISDFLKEFSRRDWGHVCLSHLFTSQAFNDGVLGLGWIASAQSGTTGGICSKITGDITYNTAWSSSKNSGGDRLTTLEANLVAAHEFGHNWGSPHDPDGCTGNREDGQYLMYQYSVNGFDQNNNIFSSCSKTTISGVIDAKADCFQDPDDAYCGNGIVEDTEQCDAGSEGLADLNRCCSTNCQFKAKYKCSDVNHDCCEDCFFVAASANKQCRFTGSVTASCFEDAFCSGTSKDCPDEEYKDNGTECGDEGGCENGVCKSFCERRGMQDCQCDDLNFACKRCCRESSSSTCEPILENNQYLDHKDGKPCFVGVCESGVCDKKIVSATERTWDVINFLTENGLSEFFRSNIVLTVVVISLLIYIPIVIIILIIDWRNDKEDDELTKEWYNKDSDKLVRDESEHVIKPTYTRRRALNNRTNRTSDMGSDVFSSRASASGVTVTGVL